MPWFLKKRWLDVEGTHVTVDVRGIWNSDVKARESCPPGNPLVKLATFNGPFSQPEYQPCFELLCPIVEALSKIDGRSILQIICSHGRNRSATLGVGLSAVYDIPVWLPTFGGLQKEWWAIAKLPDDVMGSLRQYQAVARGPVPPPTAPPFDGAGRDYGHGVFDPNGLEGSMPSVGNAVLDAVRLDVWKVAPSVLIELDQLQIDERCMRSVANLAGHSDDGAKFVRELFQVIQRENSDRSQYDNPAAAITSAVRKELDRLRPNIPGLPGSSGDRPPANLGPHARAVNRGTPPGPPPRDFVDDRRPFYDDRQFYDDRRGYAPGDRRYDPRDDRRYGPPPDDRRDDRYDDRDRRPYGPPDDRRDDRWANYRPPGRRHYEDDERLSDPGHPSRPAPHWLDRRGEPAPGPHDRCSTILPQRPFVEPNFGDNRARARAMQSSRKRCWAVRCRSRPVLEKRASMGNKRAVAVRKQQEKAAVRRRQKEEKLAKRNEKTFAKSLANFHESSFERARAFVDSQLDDNPAWIHPLADLIRDGALQALLKSPGATGDQSGRSAGPEKWVGKAKSFGELPDEVKVFMLEAIGVRMSETGVPADVLNSFFSIQFFVHEDVPLPAGSRSFEVLEKLAKERFAALNNHKVAPSVDKDFDGNCWALDDGSVTFALTGDVQKLPALSEKDVWVLDHQDCPCGRVYSQANPAVAFECRTLFPDVREIDPKAKWALKKAKKD
ncbi:mao [Symbiodinium sp. CCMP2592]|nr:mao [Symbiodinium sp. CCMP2592]